MTLISISEIIAILIIAVMIAFAIAYLISHWATLNSDRRLVWGAIDIAAEELTTLQIHKRTGVPIGKVHLIVDELEAKGQVSSRHVATHKQERGGRPERLVSSVL